MSAATIEYVAKAMWQENRKLNPDLGPESWDREAEGLREHWRALAIAALVAKSRAAGEDGRNGATAEFTPTAFLHFTDGILRQKWLITVTEPGGEVWEAEPEWHVVGSDGASGGWRHGWWDRYSAGLVERRQVRA